MSRNWFSDVLAFARKFNLPLADIPRLPPVSVSDLKLRHIAEEAGELREAFARGDLAGVADACADLIYVAISTAQATGIDLRPVWDAVHESNMAKELGCNRQDRRLLKPYGWKPPAIKQILMRQRPLSELSGLPEPAAESNGAPPDLDARCWCGHRLDRELETGAFLPCAFCIGLAARGARPTEQETSGESNAARRARRARETAERFAPSLTQPSDDNEDEDPDDVLVLSETKD